MKAPTLPRPIDRAPWQPHHLVGDMDKAIPRDDPRIGPKYAQVIDVSTAAINKMMGVKQ